MLINKWSSFLLLSPLWPLALRPSTGTNVFPLFVCSFGAAHRRNIIFRRYSTVARLEYIRSHRQERTNNVPVSYAEEKSNLWTSPTNCSTFPSNFAVYVCSALITITTRPVRRFVGPETISSGTIPAASRATKCVCLAGRELTVRKVSTAGS